jgi:(4S)-4-hydroxy-5-phosphonooxypentane-2,3-dione isomerase
MHAVLVSLRAVAGHSRDLRAAAVANATASLTHEPGCLRFDVIAGEDEDTVLLYEIYADADAFAQHREHPHFARWREAVELYVVPGSQQTRAGALLNAAGRTP